MFFPPQRLTRTKQCRRFALPARNEIMLVRPARMRGVPYSSSRRPRSPLPTNPVLLVSPRASQVSQQPYGSEPVHLLHLPALMRVTSLTPHQDDPVVRYPAITPPSTVPTVQQFKFTKCHINSTILVLNCPSNQMDFRHIMKVALKLIPAPNVHFTPENTTVQRPTYPTTFNTHILSFTLERYF